MCELSLCEKCKYADLEHTRFLVEILADANVTCEPFMYCKVNHRTEFQRWTRCSYLEVEDVLR